MTIKNLNNYLEEYATLQAQIKPLQEKIEELKDELKSQLEAEEIEKYNNGKFSISYVTVKSTRLDQKKAIDIMTPEQRKQCVVESESKRFQISELKSK